MSILDIEFEGEETADAEMKDSLAKMRAHALERRQACIVALPALARLVEVMHGRSGQPYKVREILFSLWNSKPCDLLHVVNLDWEIRKDLVAVILAFGYEDSKVKCFYDALKSAVERSGNWDWFIEESENLDKCREYVKAQDERRKEDQRK